MGALVGWLVGEFVGLLVGEFVGWLVGWFVGLVVVGLDVGVSVVGLGVGLEVVSWLAGESVGLLVGLSLELLEGLSEGSSLWFFDGFEVGALVVTIMKAVMFPNAAVLFKLLTSESSVSSTRLGSSFIAFVVIFWRVSMNSPLSNVSLMNV